MVDCSCPQLYHNVLLIESSLIVLIRRLRYVVSMTKYFASTTNITLISANFPAGHAIADDDFGVLLASVADDLPAVLHWVMFVPNIMSLGDKAQQKAWLPLCRDWKIIDCYA